VSPYLRHTPVLPALVALSLFLGLAATTVEAQSATTVFAAPAAALDPSPNGAGSSNPTPAASSTPTASSNASRPGSSFPLLSQDQANGLFDGFLSHGFLLATDGIRDGLQRLVDDANLVTNTSPTWTYQQPTVMALQRAVQMGSNAALGLLIFWLGLNVLLRPQLGGTYTEPHEVIPRLVLGAGLANSAPHWTALAIDVNNTVCANLLAVTSGSLTDLLGRFPVFDHTWTLALLLVAFLVVWLWLFLKMAARVALLMVLLVLAPAAQMCWVLPQTRHLADRWHEKFWPTLYAQVVVAVALKLAWGFAGNAGSNPIALLITICLLFLAASAPELLASGAARMGLGGLVESVLLLARTAGSGASAGAASVGAVGAGAAGGALAGAGGGAGVAAAPVPHVAPSTNTVSGQNSGTGGGMAASNKTAGYGRGGRPAAASGAGGWAATNKGSRPEPVQRAANA
jgi:hypothetical protein